MNLSKKTLPHYLRSAGRGGAGDMSSMSAYFATALRLAWILRAISAFGTPSASIDRISFLMSRGTVISSILPGRLGKVSVREHHTARAAPLVPGGGPRALSAQFAMTAMLKKR